MRCGVKIYRNQREHPGGRSSKNMSKLFGYSLVDEVIDM